MSVLGVVQGVGFRPFVWREATKRGLRGFVSNDAGGVVIEVEGSPENVKAFMSVLATPAALPPLAHVEAVTAKELPVVGDAAFVIATSDATGVHRSLLPSDTAICSECLREMHDPGDRRYRHPFINCTSCGPRYTIVDSVPYDRARTTMSVFPMCDACRAEYEDPADRRFHAEPVACQTCGPKLRLIGHSGDPVAGAAQLLREGSILAVKGIGGYHLAADACSEPAVSRLRARKHREERPFAVMVESLESARAICDLSDLEGELLTSPARPIVIAQRKDPCPVASAVAPHAPTLGVMLAYSPVHVLLLEAFGGPLVMTSGNVSDEPIAFLDEEARRRLAALADAFLVHDREIRTRVDDSVVKAVRGRALPIRRSRGYVPAPISLPFEVSEPVLAAGAELKNTFCVARGHEAFVSEHIGDVNSYETLQAYSGAITHLTSLLDVTPAVVAHDLHPDFLSTRHATELAAVWDAQLVAVQHHHAHIASCLVDNAFTGTAIGVAFDGFGLGCDQHAWGGEFLLADLTSFTRVAHLAEVPMPGGDAAVRQPWRMALSHLDRAFPDGIPTTLAIAGRHSSQWDVMLGVARSGVHSPLTSSAGRLFDAVSALFGLRDEVSYEGQAAIELEYAAEPSEIGSYPLPLVDGELQVSFLVRRLAEELSAGVAVPVLAARFHNSLADAVLRTCSAIRAEHGVSTVALSGGVFQNALLLSRCLDRLESAGFLVLTHRQVPPNDGGLSLGQVAIAGQALIGGDTGP